MAANQIQPGQMLGDYRLLQQLGRGGFAEVFLAEHQYLNHRVAIKVLTIPLDKKESDRFIQEARTMVRLKHPHIVGCSDFRIEQGVPFLVMDYVTGGTLRDRYPDGSIVPLADVVKYVSQVAEALQYAHDQGVIHLDVKPENMLLDASGKVLLSDFGLARFTHSISQKLKLTSLIGTVGYMAPEFLQSSPQAATDQYALAMVAYEWLVGTLPFSGLDERAVALQHMGTPPPSLRNYDPTLPGTVDDVIRAALAKAPEERYPNIGEFANALAQASTTPVDGSVDLDLVPEKPETLYKEGLRAKGQGKLEQAEHLLSTLQSRAPLFRQDVVQVQLQQIREKRRPQLVAQYRAEAEAASEVGAWDQEIAAWNELIQLNIDVRTARTRIRLAQEHQQNEHLYQDAKQMLDEGNKEGARLALQQLWQQDKYYGDPEGLAKKAKKVTAPPTYQQKQIQTQKEEARKDRKYEAKDRSADRDKFRMKAFGPYLHYSWIACCSWLLLLTGISATLGALTQSWLFAILALALIGIAGYLLGYRKGLDPLPLVITSVIGLVLTIALTLTLARLNYAYPISTPYTVSISTGFFSSKDVTQYHLLFLSRQLNFGLICGAITALAAIITSVIMRPPWGKKEDSSPYTTLRAFRSARKTPEPEHLTITQLVWVFLCTWIAGGVVSAIIAGIAVMSAWGFGWGVGANMMLLGFLLGSILGVGIGASFPIWWTALTD